MLRENSCLNIEEQKNDEQRRRRYFTLQWHVTAKCLNSCSHCYLQESEGYQSEIKNELSVEQCLEIIDDFYEMVKAWGVGGRINFTGGDPLLKNDIFKLIEHARSRDIVVGILGNGETLNYETALKLKESGVSSYQVSIDGTEKTHDRLRRKGSFRATIEGLRILNKVGIRSVVMSTVSKQNIDEIAWVANIAAKENVSIFDFARLTPIGKGSQFKNDLIKPKEYRSFLLKMLEEYQRLEKNGYKTYFGRKDHLWKLLYRELGLFQPLTDDREIIFQGCAIGIHLIVIAADGTVYPCRRLPIKIGKVPEQSLRDIFINSPELNKIRQVEKMEKCSKCDLFQYCRGCPAVAYGFSGGNYFAPDPQCWKKI